jgi:hypothetical protein
MTATPTPITVSVIQVRRARRAAITIMPSTLNARADRIADSTSAHKGSGSEASTAGRRWNR